MKGPFVVRRESLYFIKVILNVKFVISRQILNE